MSKNSSWSGDVLNSVMAMVRDDVANWMHTDVPVTVELIRTKHTLVNQVLQINVNVGIEKFDVYVKKSSDGTTNRLLANEYHRSIELAKYFNDTRPAFGIAQVIAYHDEPQMLVLQGVKGTTLLETIQHECRYWRTGDIEYVAACANQAGRWAKQLEESSQHVGNGNDVYEVMIQTALDAIRRIDKQDSAPVVHATSQQCIRIIKAAADAATDMPTYLAHGDLHPQNIIITDDNMHNITVIDMALSRPQWLGFDALSFAHHIRFSFRTPRYRPTALKHMMAGFNKGYDRNMSSNSPTANAIRASLVLNSLAYLTGADQGGIFRRLQCHMDKRTLTHYIATKIADELNNTVRT